MEEIPAEYLRPARPTGAGQTVVVIAGETVSTGQQLTTAYLDDNQWMMVPLEGQMVGSVLDGTDLCRIWKG